MCSREIYASSDKYSHCWPSIYHDNRIQCRQGMILPVRSTRPNIFDLGMNPAKDEAPYSELAVAAFS